MIHILFVPGSFGSMLEWGIRSYSKEYENDDIVISSPNITDLPMFEEGSMHNFKKTFHPQNKNDLNNIKNLPISAITTPIYPIQDARTDEIVNFFKTDNFKKDSIIFIKIKNIDVAEKIMLMSYYKIVIRYNNMNYFFVDCTKSITKWNPTYKHWSDMKPWEFREWVSLSYHQRIEEWINVDIPLNWYVIDPVELAGKYFDVLHDCFSYLKLNFKNNTQADTIVNQWQAKQQTIFKEHELLKTIVNYTTEKKYLEWNTLNPIAEAIIQKRLRDKNYAIKCFGLDVFPTNSYKLFDLLEKR